MGLIERLMLVQEPKIPVHQFTAAMGLWERGLMTRGQVISAFDIITAEEAELDQLKTKIVPPANEISLGSFQTLTNVGTAADAIAVSKGLGLAYIETAGISRIAVAIKVNKIGTGTQTWQLWNETDGNEIIAANDSGAAGDKTLFGSHDFTPSLGPGLKLIRIRAWSTVAADDPVFYGAGIVIYRSGVMWSKILEEVLALAEQGVAPVSAAASVRTMLGLS